MAPARQPITVAGPVAGVTVEVPAGGQQALAWFATELPVLLAATRHAADTGLDVHTWQLAWTLAAFLDRRGYWRDLAEVGRAALVAAQRLADRPTQAPAHRNLAHASSQLGELDDAHRHQQQGLDLSRQAGDDIGQARSHP